MSASLSRRNFVAGLAAAGAAFPLSRLQAMTSPPPAAGIRTACGLAMVAPDSKLGLTEKFKLLQQTGFDGVELNAPNGFSTEELLAARDATGLVIHGVVDSVHWGKPFSHPDPAVRAEGLKGLEQALRDARAYGADNVLVVPAVVNKQVSYADAYQRSQAEIRKALPLAQELGVKIAIENVWNNFLLSPLEFARYIDEFESDMVGAYFDVGNIVRYGWPEQWIRTLGKRILRLHIKEYSRKKQNDEGPWKGFSVELMEGDNDWPTVLKALHETGFQGWATLEVGGGNQQRLVFLAERLGRILSS